jgi:rhodanese-related sulfurtransferase
MWNQIKLKSWVFFARFHQMKRFILLFVVLVLGWYGLRLLPVAQARQTADRPTEFVLLDVRTQEEFETRHVRGARLVPHDEIRARAGDLPQNKNKPIVVYCRRGIRSRKATEKLNGMGYMNVYDLGGREHWSREATKKATK